MDLVIDTSALITVIVGEPERNRIVEVTDLRQSRRLGL